MDSRTSGVILFKPLASSNGNGAALRKAGLFYLVFVMFSYTTGGPFGLEDMVSTSGPGNDSLYYTGTPGQVFNPGSGLGYPDLAKLAGDFG